MFSRFTKPARQVVQRAFREAKRSQHDFVGTEHLLHGLLCDADGSAKALLRSLQVPLQPLLDQVEASLRRHDAVGTMDQFPLSPAIKRVFESALAEASALQHQLLGPLHLLLAILYESDCEAAQILITQGVTLAAVRTAVAQMPPDSLRETQLQTGDSAQPLVPRALSAAELEEHIQPTPVCETAALGQMPLPRFLEGQLLLTQIALAAFAGYMLGQWTHGWKVGILIAVGGCCLAALRNKWVSILVGTVLPAILVYSSERFRIGEYRIVPVLMMTGALIGTFLGDGWGIVLNYFKIAQSKAQRTADDPTKDFDE